MVRSRSESQIFIGGIILAAALMAFIFLPELNAIVLGVSFAVLFQPCYALLRKWFGGHDSAAAGLVVLLAIVIILLPLVFFGLQIFIEAQGLYGHLASGSGEPVINWFRMELARVLPVFNIDFSSYVQQLLGVVIGDLGPIFSGVLGVIATFFLSFFALYYFLRDGSKLCAAFIARGPLSAARAEEVLSSLYSRASSVIRGSLAVGVLYGLLTGIGFFIFGLPSAILWGAVTVVASFIPGVGVLLIVVPGIISLYLAGNIIGTIGLTAWMFFMAITMETYIRPRFLGGKKKIHPMLMLFAVLGGLSFFGPIGLLLGPLSLGLLLTLLEIYPLFALENLKRK